MRYYEIYTFSLLKAVPISSCFVEGAKKWNFESLNGVNKYNKKNPLRVPVVIIHPLHGFLIYCSLLVLYLP